MSKKKTQISSKIDPDEKQLFRDSLKGAKPIKQDKHSLKKEQEPTFSAPKPPQANPHGINIDNLPPENWLQPDDYSDFTGNGIPHKTQRKLRSGKFTIEASLDLHSLTADEAIERVDHFLHACSSHKKRWLCIIHGKGFYSKESRSILKTLLNQWLRTHPKVLAFCSAKPKDGGTGALYVLIKLGN
jgi:DNA-nicking Smr family endonuclease